MLGGQFLHGATFYGTVYICERNESSRKMHRNSSSRCIENNFKIKIVEKGNRWISSGVDFTLLKIFGER